MRTALAYGMVGGGEGSFIGDIHRKAAAFDQRCLLAAGCFSSRDEKSKETGRKLGLPDERIYADFREMAEAEAGRSDGIRFVVIATPNHTHYEITRTFLEQGIHVVCEKPLAGDLNEAEELARIARKNGLLVAVAYAYSGYPMVKQARELVRGGKLGSVNMVIAEYPQEWLLYDSAPIARMDPAIQGKSCSVADIGVHIHHTVSYVTGLAVDSLCADLQTYARQMPLENNANILVRYVGGASGVYWCSQVAAGSNNGLKLRIFGSLGSLTWEQENPDRLLVAAVGEPVQVLTRGRDDPYTAAARFNRVPAGHPEGIYEAFANLYREFSRAVIRKIEGGAAELEEDYPRIEDGIEGVRFVECCLESNRSESRWVPYRLEQGSETW